MNNPNISKQGKKFSKDYQPENSGRKLSRIKQFAKESDLSEEDVSRSIQLIIDMNESELDFFIKDVTNPILLRGFAGALSEEVKRNGLQNIMMLLDRAHGKPKEKITMPDGLSVKIEIIGGNKPDEK